MNQPAREFEKPMTNANTMPHTEMSDIETPANRFGAAMSLIGLVTWLAAMVLAVLTPMLDLAISTNLILGMVISSGVISLLSLPTLLSRVGKTDQT